MQTKNAIAMMSRFGTVRRHRGEYRARVGRGTISFRDVGGQAVRLRVVRDDWLFSCRSVTRALHDALHQVVALPTSKGLLSVRIERQGRSLTPCAAFIPMTIENQDPLRLRWPEDAWGDDEALRTAQAAIDGTTNPALLLKWLERRGGNIAGFLAGC